jgi:hypothetical protein
VNDPNEEIPEPKIGKVKNYKDLPAALRRKFQDGLLLLLEGEPVDDGAIAIDAYWGSLRRFDTLYRVVQAVKAGKDVGRDGRIPDVPGSRGLEVLAGFEGSYATPLRLCDPAPDELVTDYGEIDALLRVLSIDPESSDALVDLSERIGDDLRELLAEIGTKGLDMKVEAIQRGHSVGEVSISRAQATDRAVALDEKSMHDLGTTFVTGRLFRIDTKKSEIRIDVLVGPSKYETERVAYEPSQLETLTELLDGPVTAEVAISEERRPYEKRAKSQALKLRTIDRASQ